jgi:hypothetical protein
MSRRLNNSVLLTVARNLLVARSNRTVVKEAMESLADNTQRDQAVNAYLAAYYGENPNVMYLDINSIFI